MVVVVMLLQKRRVQLVPAAGRGHQFLLRGLPWHYNGAGSMGRGGWWRRRRRCTWPTSPTITPSQISSTRVPCDAESGREAAADNS